MPLMLQLMIQLLVCTGTTSKTPFSILEGLINCMDADLEEHYRELLREWLKDDDCITDKLHEDKIVKKARKEGHMEDSFDISEQNSWERGVCNFFKT